MKKNNPFRHAIIIVIAVLFAGCGSSGKIDETPTSGNIKISVDESYSLIMDTQVSTFEAIYTYAVVNAAYKTEVDCITDLLNDSARLIVVNRKLSAAEEQQLNNIQIIPKTTKIAYDALALIIHKGNKDTIMTYEQIEDIFKGKTSKWSQINPASTNGDIKMVFDNNKSGNPRYFKEKFKLEAQFPDYCYAVNSNEEVISYVEKNPGAIGIISVNWISDTRDSLSQKFLDRVKIAAISDEGNYDGPFLKPHQAYIADGSYPFVREVYMISREYFNGLGTGFVHFVAGEKGQRIILKSGLVPTGNHANTIGTNKERLKKMEVKQMKTKTKKIASAVFILVMMFAVSVMAQPTDPAITKARAFTNSEQFDSARDAFEALIQTQPNNGDVYFYYGENYLIEYYNDTVYTSKSAAVNAAQKLFQKAIELDPNNTAGYVGMGKISLMKNDEAGAEKYFADAQAKFPSKANKTSTILPDKQARTLAKIAESYLIVQRKKNVTKALEMLQKAVELDGKNSEIFLLLGDAYLENNDGSNAISQYKMAQELNPKSPSAKLRLGNLWIRARNYAEAIDYYKEAIEIDPNFAPAYLELGVLYSKANQLELSMQNFKKYLDISTNVTAKIKFVNVLIESQKYKDAIEQLNQIAKSDTSRNDLNRAFAYCYYETADYENALAYISKFFNRAEPEKILVSDYLYYGKILSKNKQDSLAIVKFEEALLMDSTQYDIYSEIANSYSRLKKFGKSAEAYQKKIDKGASSLSDYYKLGLVYYNMKNWIKADETYKYVTETKAEFMNGKAFYYRGLVNANIDSTGVTWQAKPYFESYIEIVKNDSVKYTNDLITCYDYLASFYFLGPEKDICKARFYWGKMIMLKPEHERALDLLDETKNTKCL